MADRTTHPPRVEERSEATAPRRRGVAGFFTELPVLVLIAFALALLMKTFLVQAFFIPSSSMEPTLHINDRVLVNKLTPRLREPTRGELIVFSEGGTVTVDNGPWWQSMLRSVGAGLGLVPPGERDFIKRVIALPGETVEVRDGQVLIDGEVLPEEPVTEGGYLSARDFGTFGPVTVPEGEYFVMGDNRPSSADSRSSLGTIPEDDIIGRAFVIIWPLNRIRTLPVADYPGFAGPTSALAPGAGGTSIRPARAVEVAAVGR